jgi:hypothetical protein
MRREKTQINEIRNGKGEITLNTKESSGTTLKTYIQINWKIDKKCTNF